MPSFAEYAVPVHPDAPHVNPLGVKGVAELAMVGVAPAIANAILHATGKRIRSLPVTPDKLL
jgi:xanthine dehydrogenase YagR molybdenum-binding subunit